MIPGIFWIVLVGLFIVLPFITQRLSIVYLRNPNKRTYKYKIGFLFTFLLSLFIYIYPLIDDVYSLFACLIGFLYLNNDFLCLPSIVAQLSYLIHK